MLFDGDQSNQQRDPLPSKGDDPRQPLLAWTLLWEGTYSNLSGDVIGDRIQRLGYVMRDASRIEIAGAGGI